MGGFRVEVVEDALDDARIQEESFDAVAVPGPAGVSRFSVDVEVLA